MIPKWWGQSKDLGMSVYACLCEGVSGEVYFLLLSLLKIKGQTQSEKKHSPTTSSRLHRVWWAARSYTNKTVLAAVVYHRKKKKKGGGHKASKGKGVFGGCSGVHRLKLPGASSLPLRTQMAGELCSKELCYQAWNAIHQQSSLEIQCPHWLSF